MAVSYLSCRPLSHRRVGRRSAATLSTTTTFSTSLFPSALLSTHAYLSTYLHRSTLRTHTLPPLSLSVSRSLPFSKHYFSSATNAKLKRISPILSVNMSVQLPRVARSFSSASTPASLAPILTRLPHVSHTVVYPTIFAILLTIIRIRRSANGYGECRTAATGTTATGCFTFPR